MKSIRANPMPRICPFVIFLSVFFALPARAGKFHIPFDACRLEGVVYKVDLESGSVVVECADLRSQFPASLFRTRMLAPTHHRTLRDFMTLEPGASPRSLALTWTEFEVTTGRINHVLARESKEIQFRPTPAGWLGVTRSFSYVRKDHQVADLKLTGRRGPDRAIYGRFDDAGVDLQLPVEKMGTIVDFYLTPARFLHILLSSGEQLSVDLSLPVPRFVTMNHDPTWLQSQFVRQVESPSAAGATPLPGRERCDTQLEAVESNVVRRFK